jgi:hypothetical protein
MCVVFTVNYFFSGRRRPCRQRNALGDRLRESEDQVGSVFLDVFINIGCACIYSYE